MGKNIISLQLSQKDLWIKADKQGYVFVKSESGYISKEELDSWGIRTLWSNVFLNQKTYGIKWAFTREELE